MPQYQRPDPLLKSALNHAYEVSLRTTQNRPIDQASPLEEEQDISLILNLLVFTLNDAVISSNPNPRLNIAEHFGPYTTSALRRLLERIEPNV